MNSELVERVSAVIAGHIGPPIDQLPENRIEQRVWRRHGTDPGHTADEVREIARAIIPIVREDEREACAKVAETKFADHGWDAPYRNAGLGIATAIRERTSHE